MAVDMFLKLAGIDGESKDSKHKDEIEILSFSWGVDQTGTVFRSGNPEASDLSLMMRYTRASVKLLERALTGERIADGLLTLRKSGQIPLAYLKYKLTDIVVSSYQTSASGGDDGPMDSVALNFASVAVDYTEQRDDGSAGGTTSTAWDFRKNAKA